MRSVVDRKFVMRLITVTVLSRATENHQNPTELGLDVAFHPFVILAPDIPTVGLSTTISSINFVIFYQL